MLFSIYKCTQRLKLVIVPKSYNVHDPTRSNPLADLFLFNSSDYKQSNDVTPLNRQKTCFSNISTEHRNYIESSYIDIGAY